jgi:glycosyltransferase involved in cell wall biosynthesis
MRVAVWLQGGIGGGNYSQGYPPLFYFIMGLGRTFQITVYSVFPANEDFQPENFVFRSVDRRIKNAKLRTLLLIILFIRDHLRVRFALLHAFWVYPAGTIAVILGKLLRIPSIVTVQGGEVAAIKEINYGNMLRPWLKKVTMYTCENATVLNTISKFLLSQLERNGMKRKDGVVIPFGPDTSAFMYSEKNLTLPIQIIHVANLTEVKDQATLLNGFKKLRQKVNATLTIIGADYMNGKLHKLAEELGVTADTRFVGALPQHALPPYYAGAHFMIHTSLHEGQSGVIMEAMASGVVVCATPVGIAYDLGPSVFAIFDFKSSDGIADAIQELWRNPDEYHQRQKSARDYVMTHDAIWTQEQYSELYRQTVKRK